MSLSKNKIKYIRSLKDKKYRNINNTFVAEGTKLVFDLLKSCKCQLIAALPEIINSNPNIRSEEIIIANSEELKKATFLKTAPTIIAVFYQPEFKLNRTNLKDKLSIVLDGVQDPGNVGTIVRIADWFGIENIICSEDSADVYNPKTVQATMGSIARVSVNYTDLSSLLNEYSDFPVYGTFLDGNNIYYEELSHNGFIIMGSEGKGISNKIINYVNNKLYIPEFPAGSTSTDSLNVAVATAVVCSEFRRRKF
ncbi:MAG TPA: RNA methyltransferase [Porphyromonadaceae bacterium]|nr:RNA methyltransferase [Porphyromonadaceae bacterium]